MIGWVTKRKLFARFARLDAVQRTLSRRMKMEKSVLKIVRRNCTGMYGGVDNEQRKLLVVFAGPHRLKRFRRSFGAFTVFVWQCLGAVVTLLARWQSPIGGSHFHTPHSHRECGNNAIPPIHHHTSWQHHRKFSSQ